MLSSYQFSNQFDPISILTGAAWSLWSLLRIVALLLLGAVGLAAIFALVVAFWLPIAQIAGCLAIVAAFAWVTFPRTAVRNG